MRHCVVNVYVKVICGQYPQLVSQIAISKKDYVRGDCGTSERLSNKSNSPPRQYSNVDEYFFIGRDQNFVLR